MITRMGNGAASISTQSPPPVATKPSTSSVVIRRTVPSHPRVAFGVKTFETSRRRRVWSGASESISDRRISRASASRSQRLVWPIAEENTSGFRETSRTSAWRVTAQKPLSPYGCQTRPSVSRIRVNPSCGMPSR